MCSWSFISSHSLFFSGQATRATRLNNYPPIIVISAPLSIRYILKRELNTLGHFATVFHSKLMYTPVSSSASSSNDDSKNEYGSLFATVIWGTASYHTVLTPGGLGLSSVNFGLLTILFYMFGLSTAIVAPVVFLTTTTSPLHLWICPFISASLVSIQLSFLQFSLPVLLILGCYT